MRHADILPYRSIPLKVRLGWRIAGIKHTVRSALTVALKRFEYVQYLEEERALDTKLFNEMRVGNAQTRAFEEERTRKLLESLTTERLEVERLKGLLLTRGINA